jgi:spermidine synthase
MPREPIKIPNKPATNFFSAPSGLPPIGVGAGGAVGADSGGGGGVNDSFSLGIAVDLYYILLREASLQSSMKPRVVIATSRLSGGETLELVEHDQRAYLHVHGQQLAGPHTALSEAELARLACAPFRSARQPRVLVLGLALGRVLAAALEALPQQRARFTVAEAFDDLARWHREGLAGLNPETLQDKRVKILAAAPAAALRKLEEAQHAILLHLDAGPLAYDGRTDTAAADNRWLAAARDALLPGGMLAIAATRPHPTLRRRLEAAGFEVAESVVAAAPQAKRPQEHFVWLARRRVS